MTKAKTVQAADEPVRRLRLEWVDPATLDDNPKNWRTHGDGQLAALDALLGEVEWAGALLFNEATGCLIDGHARKKVALARGEAAVPVLVGSWTPAQEAKLLATLDPLAAMAGADAGRLDELLRSVQSPSGAVADLLTQLAADHGLLGEKGQTQLRDVEAQAPPRMSWVLVGIPTVRFAEIAADIERMAALPGVFVETTVGDEAVPS
jgi:hypothetical protein